VYIVVFDTGLMFLTRLPCPGWCDHSPPFLMRSTTFFPLFGAAIGFWGAVFFNAAAVLLPTAVAAGVSTLATVHITGCFHEDGLADCFDGFGASCQSCALSRDKTAVGGLQMRSQGRCMRQAGNQEALGSSCHSFSAEVPMHRSGYSEHSGGFCIAGVQVVAGVGCKYCAS